MKPLTFAALAGLFTLAACSTMGRPYISGEDACDELVDARERLDCLERADRAESEWRDELKREEAEKNKNRRD